MYVKFKFKSIYKYVYFKLKKILFNFLNISVKIKI